MSDGFDLLAHAAGDSDPDLALEAQAHAVFLALPDTGVHNAFPRIIEFDVLKVLETPIEDFEAVLCTGRITAGAHHGADRSEEHTSELQSRGHLVCRLLLER